MENPRLDFEEESYEAISHSYKDGFNDGVRSVLSKTGFFLVKDERVYAVDIPLDFKFQKSVDLMTGEVHYPTNRMRLRGMTDKELAQWLANEKNCSWNDGFCGSEGASENDFLAWLKAPVEEVDNGN